MTNFDDVRRENKKDISEPKYKLLIKKRHGVGLKQYNDYKAFIKYSNDMDGIFENIEEYNANCRNTKYWSYLVIWLMILVAIKNLNKLLMN